MNKDYTSPSNEDKIFSAGIPLPTYWPGDNIHGIKNGAIIEAWLERRIITKDMLSDEQRESFKSWLDKY